MIDLARLFSSHRNALAGLDIGRDAVRMVELSRARSGVLTLERYGRADLRNGAVGSDGITDLDHVIAIAQRLWQQIGGTAGKAAIGIPVNDLVMHAFSIPGEQHETSLETLARERIAPLLNCHLDDACIDFGILDGAMPAPAQRTLQVAAARKESVDDRVAIAESLALQVVVADADSYAAHAALTRAMAFPASGAIALLHLDGRGTQLTLYDDGGLIHARPYASQADQAEAPACALERSAATVAQELQTLRHNLQIDQILLAGTSAVTPGLAAAVQQHTGIATAVANPFLHMTLAAGVDATRLSSEAAAYVVACGLALRRFD